MSTRQGTHLEHVALTGFLMICGGGAYPKKSSGAKKLLRLSPPHRVQSPEVPFCCNREGKKQKPRPWSMVAWLCGTIPAIVLIRLGDFVRPVRS